MEPWYNDPEQMKVLCRTLDTFDELLSARATAYRSNKEVLDCFIVRNTWYLDQFGQVSAMTPIRKYDEKLKTYFGITLKVPDFLSLEDYRKCLPEGAEWGNVFGSGQGLPQPHLICPECSRGWTMANSGNNSTVHEYLSVDLKYYVGHTLAELRADYRRTDGVYTLQHEGLVRNDRWINMEPSSWGDPKNEKGWACSTDHPRADRPSVHYDDYVIQEGDETLFSVLKFYHKHCLSDKVSNETLRNFKNSLEAAGFNVKSYYEVENKYGSEPYNGPWYMFQTQQGNVQAGWRKRVIDLDFSDVAPKFLVSDDVTKEEGSAHAWSYEMMTKYLTEALHSVQRT